MNVEQQSRYFSRNTGERQPPDFLSLIFVALLTFGPILLLSTFLEEVGL